LSTKGRKRTRRKPETGEAGTWRVLASRRGKLLKHRGREKAAEQGGFCPRKDAKEHRGSRPCRLRQARPGAGGGGFARERERKDAKEA
jgi:hypothetical protein